MKRVLLIGAYGQVGQELIRTLSAKIGFENIVCCDLKNPPSHLGIKHHITLDSVNTKAVEEVIQKYNAN